MVAEMGGGTLAKSCITGTDTVEALDGSEFVGDSETWVVDESSEPRVIESSGTELVARGGGGGHGGGGGGGGGG